MNPPPGTMKKLQSLPIGSRISFTTFMPIEPPSRSSPCRASTAVDGLTRSKRSKAEATARARSSFKSCAMIASRGTLRSAAPPTPSSETAKMPVGSPSIPRQSEAANPSAVRPVTAPIVSSFESPVASSTPSGIAGPPSLGRSCTIFMAALAST